MGKKNDHLSDVVLAVSSLLSRLLNEPIALLRIASNRVSFAWANSVAVNEPLPRPRLASDSSVALTLALEAERMFSHLVRKKFADTSDSN